MSQKRARAEPTQSTLWGMRPPAPKRARGEAAATAPPPPVLLVPREMPRLTSSRIARDGIATFLQIAAAQPIRHVEGAGFEHFDRRARVWSPVRGLLPWLQKMFWPRGVPAARLKGVGVTHSSSIARGIRVDGELAAAVAAGVPPTSATDRYTRQLWVHLFVEHGLVPVAAQLAVWDARVAVATAVDLVAADATTGQLVAIEVKTGYDDALRVACGTCRAFPGVGPVAKGRPALLASSYTLFHMQTAWGVLQLRRLQGRMRGVPLPTGRFVVVNAAGVSSVPVQPSVLSYLTRVAGSPAKVLRAHEACV